MDNPEILATWVHKTKKNKNIYGDPLKIFTIILCQHTRECLQLYNERNNEHVCLV